MQRNQTLEIRELNDAELDIASGAALSDRELAVVIIAGGPIVWAAAGVGAALAFWDRNAPASTFQ